ncbi:hypothetical protein ENUP19_0004G0076 [Entamoeba nuttalli]|uniref:Uncharacterized protein n=1 Tax=Entamoeba nuttalli TaxID=412467 RepID=A0ABQ0D7L3_9EUKA
MLKFKELNENIGNIEEVKKLEIEMMKLYDTKTQYIQTQCRGLLDKTIQTRDEIKKENTKLKTAISFMRESADREKKYYQEQYLKKESEANTHKRRVEEIEVEKKSLEDNMNKLKEEKQKVDDERNLAIDEMMKLKEELENEKLNLIKLKDINETLEAQLKVEKKKKIEGVDELKYQIAKSQKTKEETEKKLNKEIEKLKQTNREISKKLEEEIKKKEDAKEMAKAELTSSFKKLLNAVKEETEKSYQTEINQLKREIEELQKKKGNEMRNEIQPLKRKIEEIELTRKEEKEVHKKEIKDIELQKEKEIKEIKDGLTQEINQLKNEKENIEYKLNIELNDKKSEINKLKQKITSNETKEKKLINQIETLKTELSKKEQEIVEMKEAEEKLKTENEGIKEENKQLIEVSKTKEKEQQEIINQKNIDIQKVNDELNQMKTANTTITSELFKEQTTNKTLQNEINTALKIIDEMEKEIDSFTIWIPLEESFLGTDKLIQLNHGLIKEELHIPIRRGIKDNEQVKVGEYTFTIRIFPHKYCWREGDDLYINIKDCEFFTHPSGRKFSVLKEMLNTDKYLLKTREQKHWGYNENGDCYLVKERPDETMPLSNKVDELKKHYLEGKNMLIQAIKKTQKILLDDFSKQNTTRDTEYKTKLQEVNDKEKQVNDKEKHVNDKEKHVNDKEKQVNQTKDQLKTKEKQIKQKQKSLDEEKETIEKQKKGLIKKLETSIKIINEEQISTWANQLVIFEKNKNTFKDIITHALNERLNGKGSVEDKINKLFAELSEKIQTLEDVQFILKQNGSNSFVNPLIVVTGIVVVVVGIFIGYNSIYKNQK